MGGNALKNTVTERKNPQEYNDIVMAVWTRLTWVLDDISCMPVQSYRNKESFGDADFLITTKNLPHNWLEKIKFEFQPNELVSNGGVHSFDFQKFQIDLITVPDEELMISSVYYSFNDLGNLMGRVANAFGFKYGHNGLWKVLRDNNEEPIGKALVTNDPCAIFDFLGYDYARYLKGFDTLEDIFEFVASSRHFHSSIYQFENRNNKDAARDRKRPTYTAFLEWLSKRGVSEHFDWVDTSTEDGLHKKKVRIELAFHHACKMFPSFDFEVQNILHNHSVHVKAKELFNGKIVGEVTGLTGKELGEAMSKIKAFITPVAGKCTFEEWVTTQDPEHIRLTIKTALQ